MKRNEIQVGAVYAAKRGPRDQYPFPVLVLSTEDLPEYRKKRFSFDKGMGAIACARVSRDLTNPSPALILPQNIIEPWDTFETKQKQERQEQERRFDERRAADETYANRVKALQEKLGEDNVTESYVRGGIPTDVRVDLATLEKLIATAEAIRADETGEG